MTTAIVPTRESWLEERKGFITGSDAGKILGLSKWGGPMDVFIEKRGLADAQPQIEWQEAGKRLERPILEWYGEREGADLRFWDPHTLLKSATYANVAATLDAVRMNAPLIQPDLAIPPLGAPVDAKNIRYADDEWGEPLTDQMPLYYAAQLIVQMHVTGASFADIAVLFSGQDLRVYRIFRDLETEANVIGRCQRFWEDNVLRDVPPDVDGSESYKNYLQKYVRQTSEEVKSATPELHAAAMELRSLKIEAEKRDAEITRLENLLKSAIGEGRKLVGANWSATWGQLKDSTGVDWKEVAHQLLDRMKALGIAKDADIIILANQNIIVTKQGSRRFTFSLKGQ